MTTITLPLWLVILMGLGCAYAVVASMLLPSARWYLRSRLLRTVDTLNRKLQIEIRPFQRTKRQVLIDRLAWDREVLEAIDQIAATGGVSRETLQGRVLGYAREIVPAFNAYVYFLVGYWLARWVSRFVYRVHVAAVDDEQLRSVDPNAAVVFVMNHRSNMDYLLVTYLAAQRASISYAVGEWARFFPLRPLVKALGGFFVRRRSNDELYRKVLERYVDMSTREGVCQAVYLEGGLTRDGALGAPRLGYLDYMLRDFDSRRDRDVVFVPVAVNYDHVLEDNNMLSWEESRVTGRQAAAAFFRFIWRNAFRGFATRLRGYGYAGVNFGLPISGKKWVEAHGHEFSAVSRDERFGMVQRLADDLMAAIEHAMPVLPVPLISYLFDEAHEERLTSHDVAARTSALIDRIVSAGGAMRAQEKPKLGTIANALRMMVDRKILSRDDDGYSALRDEHGSRLRRYYANSIAGIVPKR